MPVGINIQFDSPYATYYAGQTVTGRVYVSVDKPKRIRAITFNIKGEAQVKWQESENKKDSQGKSYTENTDFTAQETYYENQYYLFGSANGDIELAQGEYTYPFSSQIPPTAPSSFEGEFGHIRYTVKAILDRPWKFDSEAKAAFTVVAPLDLNGLPQAKEPVEFEKSKSFCCLWCKSGPLTLTVKLPTSGYVPGQTIPFQIEIENGSNIRVRPINCVLRKEVTWHAKNPYSKTNITKTKLADLAVDAEVLPHSSASFSQDLTVPAVPPSNLSNCSIIDLQYVLKVEAVVGGLHKNLSARIPIVMGTIPLLTGPTAYKPGGMVVQPTPGAPAPNPTLDLTPTTQPAQPVPNPSSPGAPAPNPTLDLTPTSTPAQRDVSPAPPVGGGWNLPVPGEPIAPPTANASVAPSAPPLYPQLPPPSYEESIFKGNTIKDASDNEYTMGIQDFTPRYPVWSFGPTGPASPVAPLPKNEV